MGWGISGKQPANFFANLYVKNLQMSANFLQKNMLILVHIEKNLFCIFTNFCKKIWQFSKNIVTKKLRDEWPCLPWILFFLRRFFPLFIFFPLPYLIDALAWQPPTRLLNTVAYSVPLYSSNAHGRREGALGYGNPMEDLLKKLKKRYFFRDIYFITYRSVLQKICNCTEFKHLGTLLSRFLNK